MNKLRLRANEHSGKLIVFEGTDGAGKTTQIELTSRYLTDKLGAENVLCVKQPTDMSRKTKLFQKMMYCKDHDEIDYRAVQLLTMSDRVQHIRETIEPALSAGKTVICDRYIYTSLANMLARGYTREKWFYYAARHLIKPDAAFLANVEPELAIARIKSRPSECDRHLDETLLCNVHNEFVKMSKREGFTVLDTSGDATTAFAVIERTLEKAGIA